VYLYDEFDLNAHGLHDAASKLPQNGKRCRDKRNTAGGCGSIRGPPLAYIICRLALGLSLRPVPRSFQCSDRLENTAMVLNYSKWDNLELSDDSDFEPHPNVDKRSFIRAKQNQIHQQRAERKHRIETLKYERMINDGLIRRIDSLLSELKAHEAEAKDRNAFLYQALITSAGDPDEDEPPKPPGDVYSRDIEPIRYSQMMGSLVDQAKKEVDESGTDEWFKGYVRGVDTHRKKITGLQKDLAVELERLEKEETRKITSESIRDGFNSSFVAKESESVGAAKTKTVETTVLNPAALGEEKLARQNSAGQSSGADADIDEAINPLNDKEDGDDDEDVEIEPSELGKEFAKIKMGDYRSCLRFISDNRPVLAERETDGLLVMAFNAQIKGQAGLAKQCVHQALLLQYCRALGKDGVGLFFKRYVDPWMQC